MEVVVGPEYAKLLMHKMPKKSFEGLPCNPTKRHNSDVLPYSSTQDRKGTLLKWE